MRRIRRLAPGTAVAVAGSWSAMSLASLPPRRWSCFPQQEHPAALAYGCITPIPVTPVAAAPQHERRQRSATAPLRVRYLFSGRRVPASVG
jgi:hypothetical protein